MGTIQDFAQQVQQAHYAYIQKLAPGLYAIPDYMELQEKVTVKPGVKYTKVDVGTSGRFMVVNATGEIYGIKAYGVIHRGHYFGTLDNPNPSTFTR